ncbi:hypothetical protein JG688_00008653 [Phytophthora aleatoria]|uniref:Uncharacterized protein n=1 Tax=Phytophthora aleatoria TaxID=2496075 RepID=A0A8J5IUN1_9STRA|nr:hypothetical protein JG688_00008653 [Phytophthora aleatoria]
MLAAPRQPRPTTFTNRQVANFIFRPCRDHADTGYTNLMQHIRREHPAFAEEMLAATPGETGSVVHYARHSAQNTFGWLELLIKCNLPLSFCESKLARRYSNLKPISVQTLRRVLEAVTCAVERSIAAEMPERFGLKKKMNNQGLARELLRSRARELQELQAKMQMMSEALADLQYAHDELHMLLQREAEAINELTANTGGGPTPSGYTSSFSVLLERVVKILSGK